jgi:drug/metabolite transporter (DMT)-like permease
VRFIVIAVGICGVASASLLARYGLESGYSPVALSAWRLTCASLALILFQLVVKPKSRLAKEDIWKVLVAGLFMGIHFATWIASLNYVSVARSTLLVSTSPLWAGLAGLFIPRLRPKPFFWLGLLVATAGIFMITSGGMSRVALGSPPWLGDLLAVTGAICIVPYLVLSQEVQQKVGTLTTITWIYSAAAASLLLFLGPQGRLVLPPSSQVWLSIIGMAIFAQLIGHSALNFSLKRFSAAQVATASLLEPVVAASLAWVFLGEGVTALQTLGGMILLIGVGVSLSAEPGTPVLPRAD